MAISGTAYCIALDGKWVMGCFINGINVTEVGGVSGRRGAHAGNVEV